MTIWDLIAAGTALLAAVGAGMTHLLVKGLHIRMSAQQEDIVASVVASTATAMTRYAKEQASKGRSVTTVEAFDASSDHYLSGLSPEVRSRVYDALVGNGRR